MSTSWPACCGSLLKHKNQNSSLLGSVWLNNWLNNSQLLVALVELPDAINDVVKKVIVSLGPLVAVL